MILAFCNCDRPIHETMLMTIWDTLRAFSLFSPQVENDPDKQRFFELCESELGELKVITTSSDRSNKERWKNLVTIIQSNSEQLLIFAN